MTPEKLKYKRKDSSRRTLRNFINIKLPQPSHIGTASVDFDKQSPRNSYVESDGKGHSRRRKIDRFWSVFNKPMNGLPTFDKASFKKWYKKKIRNNKNVNYIDIYIQHEEE